MLPRYRSIFTSRREVCSMNRPYNSVYGPHIGQYIDLKRKLGFKYSTGGTILSQIDALAAERAETGPGITRDSRVYGAKEDRTNPSPIAMKGYGTLCNFPPISAVWESHRMSPGCPVAPKARLFPTSIRKRRSVHCSIPATG